MGRSWPFQVENGRKFVIPAWHFTTMNDGMKSTGAVALLAGGIGAAFALAACCAVPALFAGLGIGVAWLVPLVSASQPHTEALTVVSALALLGSVGVVAVAPKHCEPIATCARPWFRWTVIAAALVGAVLLVLSKIYA
jgi:mercuric ion transport protein